MTLAGRTVSLLAQSSSIGAVASMALDSAFLLYTIDHD